MKTEPRESLNIKQANIVDKYLPAGDEQRYYERLKMHEELFDLINSHCPKIKQLEWIGSEGGNVLTGIAIYAGYYRITSTPEGAFMRIATAGIRKRFDTVEEAKAAAQADFEKRIKECLV